MNNPMEWEEPELLELVSSRAEESTNREFKRADSLGIPGKPESDEKCKTEISRDVSAMANSAGGIIIYGMAEDKSEPHPATALSPIDPQQFSKDWLEQVINSRIKPRIQGLVIRSISLRTSHPGMVAHVVSVPQGFTAHQAYDKRYYRRWNFQVVAMEHYEVLQILNRRQKPAYDIEVDTYPVTPHDGEKGFKLRVTAKNPSEITGRDVSVVVLVPDILVGGPKIKAFGPLEVDGGSYLGISGEDVFTLFPLTSRRFSFQDFTVLLPSAPPSRRFPLIVRLFDEHGQAMETTFTYAFPDGRLVDTKVKTRGTF